MIYYSLSFNIPAAAAAAAAGFSLPDLPGYCIKDNKKTVYIFPLYIQTIKLFFNDLLFLIIQGFSDPKKYFLKICKKVID